MAEAQITVSILSYLLEERLIKTLIQIPRTTDLPLNLCLHVQGEEQIAPDIRQRILDATAGFMGRDIFFTRGNGFTAKPRAKLLKRSAITPYVFVTDNDMVFQRGSIDALLRFLTNPKNATYGIVDLAHNYLRWHRRINGTKVECIPLNYDTQDVIDVDLIGAASMFMRREVALIPDIIDTRYDLGTWDFDMCLNVRKKGWKIATICDKKLIAINDKTYRKRGYKVGAVNIRLKKYGLKLFESKWGFSSEQYVNSPMRPQRVSIRQKPRREAAMTQPQFDTIIISRAIYSTLGDRPAIGVLDRNRLDLMQRYFINSLRNQTNQEFSLYIAVGRPDSEPTKVMENLDWGSLDVHFIYIDDDLSQWRSSVNESGNWGREIDDGCPERLICAHGHPYAPIMARIDIDDWVAPGWVAHMKYMASGISQTHFLINYQVIGQAPDGRLYRFFAPHNPGRTSPFIALVQKSSPRISPYADVHLNMGHKFAMVCTIPPSYAFMVVHEGNRSNRIYPKDKFFGSNYVDNRRNVVHTEIKHQKPEQEISEEVVPVISWKGVRKNSWQERILNQ